MLNNFLKHLKKTFLNNRGAVDFDGTDDYLDHGDPSSLQIIGAISISAWVYVDVFPTTTDTFKVIGEKGYVTNEGYVLRLRGAGGSNTELQIGSYNGATFQNRSWTISGWSVGTWHHILGLSTGSTWQLYFDGTSVSSSSADGSGALSTTAKFFIGAGDISGSPARFFDGKITEVAVWNTNLSQTQITQLASSRVKRMPLQIAPSNLKGYWPLDDQPDGTSGDGDTSKDLSGNGNDGTGNDGANNTGLTMVAEQVLSYPVWPIYVDAQSGGTNVTITPSPLTLFFSVIASAPKVTILPAPNNLTAIVNSATPQVIALAQALTAAMTVENVTVLAPDKTIQVQPLLLTASIVAPTPAVTKEAIANTATFTQPDVSVNISGNATVQAQPLTMSASVADPIPQVAIQPNAQTMISSAQDCTIAVAKDLSPLQMTLALIDPAISLVTSPTISVDALLMSLSLTTPTVNITGRNIRIATKHSQPRLTTKHEETPSITKGGIVDG